MATEAEFLASFAGKNWVGWVDDSANKVELAPWGKDGQNIIVKNNRRYYEICFEEKIGNKIKNRALQYWVKNGNASYYKTPPGQSLEKPDNVLSSMLDKIETEYGNRFVHRTYYSAKADQRYLKGVVWDLSGANAVEKTIICYEDPQNAGTYLHKEFA